MGILTDILGYGKPDKEPDLTSIFPKQAAQKIQNGLLPTIQIDKLILGQNEICHFADIGAIITEKNTITQLEQVAVIEFARDTPHTSDTLKVSQKLKTNTQRAYYI